VKVTHGVSDGQTGERPARPEGECQGESHRAGDVEGEMCAACVRSVLSPSLPRAKSRAIAVDIGINYCYPPKNGGCREKGDRADDAA